MKAKDNARRGRAGVGKMGGNVVVRVATSYYTRFQPFLSILPVKSDYTGGAAVLRGEVGGE